MIFKRTPGQVGRNVELCHPPKYLEKVKTIMKNLRKRFKHKRNLRHLCIEKQIVMVHRDC